MQFPLSFWDVCLWLAAMAIILLATTELMASYFEQTNMSVNRKRLEKAALTIGILFLLTLVIRTISSILAS